MRLSLRVLLITCGVIAISAWLIDRCVQAVRENARDQERRRQIAKWEQRGLYPTFNSAGKITRLRWTGDKPLPTDSSLRGISKLSELEQLDWPGAVTDSGCAELHGLAKLRTLDLGDTKVTGVGFRRPETLVALEYLNFIRCKVTDQGLECVSRIPNLKSLDLTATKVTDAGLKHLSKMQSLEHLSLRDTNVSDVGMQHLAKLRNLRSLAIPATNVTDTGLKYLERLPHLEEVICWETAITGSGLSDFLKSVVRRQELSRNRQEQLRTVLPVIP